MPHYREKQNLKSNPKCEELSLIHIFILNHSSMVPIYEQLMEQIKSDIIQSELKEGEALPSVRTLAGELRILSLIHIFLWRFSLLQSMRL